MNDTTQDLILEEMRLLRADFYNFSRTTGERVSALETDVHALVGNGQPGRVALLEVAVAKLLEWRWWVLGAAAGGSTVISMIAWFLVELHK